MQDLIFKTSTRPNVKSSESKNKIFPYWQTFFNFQWTFIVHIEQSVIEWKVYACYLKDFLTHALGRYSDMISRFGRPVRNPELCMITNKVMDNNFNNHSHRISQWNRDVLSSPLLKEYADAIHAKGSPLSSEARGQTSEHARRIAWGSLRSIWKSYTHMWLRRLVGKNREIFFVFQESSLTMNRKNKRNV